MHYIGISFEIVGTSFVGAIFPMDRKNIIELAIKQLSPTEP